MMSDRATTILISALGGEGGGVLASWIVSAASALGYPCQRTSVPGVAQRTGATTYYIEIFPVAKTALRGREPVLSLQPAPGNVDILLATELVEACRAAQRGFVTPDRTTLIASTHRVFTIEERIAMADGRFDSTKALNAITALAKTSITHDLAERAEAVGSHGNAVLLGLLSGSGAIPISPEHFRDAIRADAISVEANLRGFDAGLHLACGPNTQIANLDKVIPPASTSPPFIPGASGETNDMIAKGMARLRDYQGDVYANTYLQRLWDLKQHTKSDEVLKAAARHLALLMSREDVVRVAELKTRKSRNAGIEREVRAQPGDIVQVVEILKPGLHELCGLLPPALARAVLKRVERNASADRFGIAISVKSTSITGFMQLRALAGMKVLRPFTFAASLTEAVASRWLRAVVVALERDATLAAEVADCARLIKGYGATYQRGLANFGTIETDVLAFGLQQRLSAHVIADAVIQARHAALSDDSGTTLKKMIAAFHQTTAARELVSA